MIAHFQIEMASGVYNLSVFVRIEFGPWHLNASIEEDQCAQYNTLNGSM